VTLNESFRQQPIELPHVFANTIQRSSLNPSVTKRTIKLRLLSLVGLVMLLSQVFTSLSLLAEAEPTAMGQETWNNSLFEVYFNGRQTKNSANSRGIDGEKSSVCSTSHTHEYDYRK
jgi:hypothetical protein